jgi:hypothetical protein
LEYLANNYFKFLITKLKKKKKKKKKSEHSFLILSLAIRYFIVNVIVKETSDEQKLVTNRAFISKLNMVLVQVKKKKRFAFY